jgi:hypothetical protein
MALPFQRFPHGMSLRVLLPAGLLESRSAARLAVYGSVAALALP